MTSAWLLTAFFREVDARGGLESTPQLFELSDVIHCLMHIYHRELILMEKLARDEMAGCRTGLEAWSIGPVPG